MTDTAEMHTEEQVKKAIKRLRLRRGDIVVCHDHETMKQLSGLGPRAGIDFDVPIIFAPQGVHRLSKEYLRKLLDVHD